MTWNKEKMDSAFGPTPASFGQAMQRALSQCTVQKKKTARHAPMKAVLIAAALVLACGAALAAVNSYGIDWWFTARWGYMQQLHPEIYKQALNHLQTDIPQECVPQIEGLRVNIAEAACLASEGLTYVVIEVENLRPEYELHSSWNMDVDGALGEEHDVHWLWTEKGCGVPEEVMDDPEKTLLLYEGTDLYLAGEDDDLRQHGGELGFASASDVVRSQDGKTVMALECNQELLQYADENGLLHLKLPFSTCTFANDEYGPVVDEGVVEFTIDTHR